ncbi:MAG: S1 RNA-binding domain-containing protein, partial [Flavobacteriales bacterium]
MSKKQEKETKEKTVSKVAKTKKTKSATKKTKEIPEEVAESPVTEEVAESPVTEEVAESSVTEEVAESPVAEEVVESPVTQQNQEEFNWDSIIKNEIYSDKERAELISTYSETLPVVESKQVIDGVVVSISDREVIVDINFKSDGVISSSEFKYNEDLKIGDTVEVLVEKQEDKNGQLILSHRRARVLRAWEKVNVALETGEIVNGQIKSRTKGGMIVDVFGIECFLPGSQIDVKPIRDYDEYVGRKMEFKIVKVNESFR